jgi:hypothetical protein
MCGPWMFVKMVFMRIMVMTYEFIKKINGPCHGRFVDERCDFAGKSGHWRERIQEEDQRVH